MRGLPIIPVAFEIDKPIKSKIYTIIFPEKLKNELFVAWQRKDAKFKSFYSFPTVLLDKLLNTYLKGYLKTNPILLGEKREWLLCNEPIDLDKLCELIKIWLISLFYDKEKNETSVYIYDILEKITPDVFKMCEYNYSLDLTNENKILSDVAYSAVALNCVDYLDGRRFYIVEGTKRIDFIMHRSDRNELVSDILGEGKFSHSYVLKISLQNIPPNQQPLIQFHWSIRRWIPRKWGDVNLDDNVNIHVWNDNKKITKVPANLKEKKWNKEFMLAYNIYHVNQLISLDQLLDDLEIYLENSTFTIPYKNGYNSFGLDESFSFIGVSMKTKKQLYDQLKQYFKTDFSVLSNVTRMDKRNIFDANSFSVEDKLKRGYKIAESLLKNTGEEELNIYVFASDEYGEYQDKMYDYIKHNYLMNEITSQLKINLIKQPLKDLGNPICDKELKNKEIKTLKLKRIEKIKQIVIKADKVAGAIVILPNGNYFDNGKTVDPKKEIRNGFAQNNILTQFLVPEEENLEHRMDNALKDLLRQFGIIYDFNTKHELYKNTVFYGLHTIKRFKPRLSKGTYNIPLVISLRPDGKEMFVESSIFSAKRMKYWEAELFVAKFSLSSLAEDTLKNNNRINKIYNIFQSIAIHNVKEDSIFMVESDVANRSVFKGISNKEISQYEYIDKYVPKEINASNSETSKMINLNGSGIRIFRIRSNDEVPDYITYENNKGNMESSSGIYKYKDIYWTIGNKPNKKNYKSSYKYTELTSNNKLYSERDMIEIYPIQIQKNDNVDILVSQIVGLQKGSIQYSNEESLVLPLPLHLLKKLEEYVYKY